MTLAYFDCFSGISGDMTLGALVDAGVSPDDLRGELLKLDLAGYTLAAEKVMRAGLSATRVQVLLDDREQPARRLTDVLRIIVSSSLSSAIKEKSAGIFERLARAEAAVHGTTPDKVHFHEVGAVDAMVDIVGSIIGLDLLGITSVACSAVNVGSGTIRAAHGTLPVPAPATAELLKGVPSYGSAIPFELTTPTGAAIVTALCGSFGPLPRMKIGRIAHGAGGKDVSHAPNVLRLLIGAPEEAYDEDSSIVIETNIDDMNPQAYEYVIDKLMRQGAQDAYLTPIIMKKSRPAVLLSVLTDRSKTDQVLDIIFKETTSIGVRIRETGRMKLSRETEVVDTIYGKIPVKVSRRGGEILTVTPEYEDCRRIAEERHVPLKQVMEQARALFINKSCASARDTS
jgi:hypothetical protein